MRRTKQARRGVRNRCRQQIGLQTLESRTLLSVAGQYEGSLGLVASQTSKGAVLPGKWITQFDGVDGPASQQLATIRDRLVQAGLTDVQVTQSLGAPGLVSLQSSTEIAVDQLQARLAGVPGYHSLSQDTVVSVSSLFPNDPFSSSSGASITRIFPARTSMRPRPGISQPALTTSSWPTLTPAWT
jgi:hypothetical protein